MDEAREKTPVAAGDAYISGALTALEDAARTKLFYEVLAEIAEAAGLRAYLPHRVSDPVAAAHVDPRAVYEIDRAHVTSAAVLIAYAGVPSFGVGIEVELAREHAVPVIIVAERDRPISRLLLGNPAVVEVVKFADLDGLRRSLSAALAAVRSVTRAGARPIVADDVVVQRFIASLEHARRLPAAEVTALLRIGELDGQTATAIRDAVQSGRLFAAGLRDLVGRYALRAADLGAFVLRDVLERSAADAATTLGIDPRTVRRHVATARVRVGLPEDAAPDSVAQWLVTELIAPPTRALQLHLFGVTKARH
ncbi:MAG: sigma-70 region 4 domain-containing protein [Chloroflexota bacterium]|nr:sigma-70 region 4 domain-containing protein [Chloroflexota bacterium]